MVFFFFSNIKLRGKRLPQFLGSLAALTNSGVMRNTCRPAFGTERGLLPPENQKARLPSSGALGHGPPNPTSPVRGGGKAAERVTLLQAEQPFSPCEAEQLAC